MKKIDNRGFTLVELLVVIAIIGILAAIVLVSLNSARSKARDSRRVADIRQVSLALENYYDDNQEYPDGLSSLSPTYMSTVPTDPKDGSAYDYNTTSCSPANQRYVLGGTLENANSASLNSDVDGTQCSISCADPVYCIMP